MRDGPMQVIIEPKLRTDRLGGVNVPSAERLKEMHDSQYILRASGSGLTPVPVEKALLPHSDDMSPQGAHVDLGPDGAVYVQQSQVLCKSVDGGRTWTSRSLTGVKGNPGWRWKVLRGGTFISVNCSTGQDAREPAIVWVSQDEGVTWTKRAEIPIEMNLPNGRPYTERYTHRGLNRLQDDTLLWTVDIRDTEMSRNGCYTFHSTDAGHTWRGPILMIDWGSEGAATLAPSGRVFATMRYQRSPLPSDTEEMVGHLNGTDQGRGFKNVFVMDSADGGLTWSSPRMLCTVYGQTFGYPAAQSDGTMVVIHDTRYGPGPPGSRAMISRDEGRTWLDEVYYLDSTTFTGSYSASVVFEDDTVLSICGSSQAPGSWNGVRDHTDMYAIRWQPIGGRECL